MHLLEIPRAPTNKITIMNDIDLIRDEIQTERRELEAELARLKKLIEWQDISTAPKDGTTVLLWGNGFVIPYVGNYVSRPTKAAPLARYWIMRGAGATWSARNQPTKWLPLPPAPPNPKCLTQP